jgi:hypothetical protein
MSDNYERRMYMFIFVERKAEPGEYVIHKSGGKIMEVENVGRDGEIMFDYEGYHVYGYNHWEQEEYYVMQKIYDFDIPLKYISEMIKVIDKVIRHYNKKAYEDQKLQLPS